MENSFATGWGGAEEGGDRCLTWQPGVLMVFYACYAYLCLIIDALWLIMLFTWPYSTIPEQDRGPWRGCLEPDPISDSGYYKSTDPIKSGSKTRGRKTLKILFFFYGLGRGRRRGRSMPDMRARGELTRFMGQGQLGHKKKEGIYCLTWQPGVLMVFYACYAYLSLIIDALRLIMLFTWPYSTIPEQDRGPWTGCFEPDPISEIPDIANLSRPNWIRIQKHW